MRGWNLGEGIGPKGEGLVIIAVPSYVNVVDSPSTRLLCEKARAIQQNRDVSQVGIRKSFSLPKTVHDL
jgi:hypothetical protein